VMMLVTAMFVVVMMVMAMIIMVVMIMIMVMTVIVVVVVMTMRVGLRVVLAGVMRMIIMRVAMRGAGIGATFGIERRLDLDDARAEPLHHRLDYMIAADAQPLRHELRRQMTVAEMPGDPDQMMRIASLDLEQRLGRRHHLDQPAVLQHQRIAAAERDGVFEIEQELQSARARHRHAATMTIVEIEHDGVGRRLRPAMLSNDTGRADHAYMLPPFSFFASGRRPSRA